MCVLLFLFFLCVFFVFITETSPYKSYLRFPPIVKMGEICGRYENDKKSVILKFLYKIRYCGCVLESTTYGFTEIL